MVGQGLAARTLAAAGAHRVIGIDSSEAMIEIARRYGTSNGSVSYMVDDAQQLRSCEDESFDGATCQLGLMDIPDVDATLAAVRRILKPDGWFVFVIGHPCFLVPDAKASTPPGKRPAVCVSGYFDERFWRSPNPNGVRRVGNFHRTLSTYLNGLTRNGLRLDATEEPRGSSLLGRQNPLYLQVPMFFAARAIKVKNAGPQAWPISS